MAETTWNRDPPPGFRGFRPEMPVTIYTRRLPHWRQDGATYFVTFRLGDSLPHSKLNELSGLRDEFLRRHGDSPSQDDWERFAKQTMQRVEDWLDQGMGSCILRDSKISDIVRDSMHRFDDDRYELGCYAIMPNHVHAVIRPTLPDAFPLEKILQGWKGYTSKRINQSLKISGANWCEESFDRIIRDEEHLDRCIQYIGRNPGAAKLPAGEFQLWVRPRWAEIGWGFRE